MINLADYTPKKKRWIKNHGLLCIYVMAADEAGPSKIGYARDLCARHTAVQGHNWTKISAFSAVWCVGLPIAKRVESAAHTQLADKKLTGEWFDISAGAASAIVEELGPALYPQLKFKGHSALMDYLAERNVEEVIHLGRGHDVANRL